MSTKGITSHDHKKSAQEQSTYPSSRSSELTTTPTQPVPVIQTSRLNPTIMNPRNVMQLQKTIGNRATDKLLSKSESLSFNRASASTSSNSIPLQAKFTVTPAGDKYEQEADQVAKQVINRITSPVPQPVNRQEPEEEELQMKPIQPFDRLKVRRQEEEEELQMKPLDRLRVQRQPEEDEEILQGKFKTDGIQRQVPEEEELMTKPAVQRVGLEGGDVDSELEASIQQASGSGQPLPGSVREPAENALGADFSSVKVHTGSESDSLNSSLQSRAFTTGPNIFFKQGEYNPGSSEGRELIAHELTHVVQQTGSGQAQRRDQASDETQVEPVSVLDRTGGAQRQLIQREYTDIPTAQVWTSDASRWWWIKRSSELQAVDTAVGAWPGDDANLFVKIHRLRNIIESIEKWEGVRVARKEADKSVVGHGSDLKTIVGSKLAALVLLANPDGISAARAMASNADLKSQVGAFNYLLNSNEGNRSLWTQYFIAMPVSTWGPMVKSATNLAVDGDFSWVTTVARARDIVVNVLTTLKAEKPKDFLVLLGNRGLTTALENNRTDEYANLKANTPALRLMGEAREEIGQPAEENLQEYADTFFNVFLDRSEDGPFRSLMYHTQTGFDTDKFLAGVPQPGVDPATACMGLSNMLKTLMDVVYGRGFPVVTKSTQKPVLTKKQSDIGNRGILTRTAFNGNVRSFVGVEGYDTVNRILFTGGQGSPAHVWLKIGAKEYDPTLGISGNEGAVTARAVEREFNRTDDGFSSGGYVATKIPDVTPPGGDALGFGSAYNIVGP
ncbi:hypothetical protein D1BOALGB6SA_2333 [Olavius sp. associated proteobacterium Delta 1]|nr:hypothetical protein D1BOALGB6SA_2333 [Olavius sp. associated proteobacterium Delta 1]